MKNINKSKKRILFITPWSVYGMAGTEQYIVPVINELAKSDYDVSVLLITDDADLQEELASFFRHSVTIEQLKTKRVRSAFKEIGLYLKKEQPDIIFANVVHVALVASLARFIYYRKAQLVSIQHTINNSWSFFIQSNIVSIFSHVVVAVSEGIKKFIEKKTLARKKVFLIPNGFNVKKIEQLSVEIIDEQLLKKIATDKPVIICIGRLEKEKRFQDAILAVHHLEKKYHTKSQLVFIGDGAEKDDLKNIADKKNVDAIFMGWQHNPHPYIKKSDLLLLSSEFEGFGRVLVESLALGVPVVSTNCPSGPSEILAGGEYGRLVPVGDSAALALAIKETLAEKSDSERLKKRAEDFSDDKMVGEYKRVIESFNNG